MHKSSSIWAQDNLVAWMATPPWDTTPRTPRERAEMLKRLSFSDYAYFPRGTDSAAFDADLAALKKEGINVLAWRLHYDADNPVATTMFETLKRHSLRPQIW